MTKIAVFDIDGTIYREGMSFIVAVLERKNMIYELDKVNGAYTATTVRPIFNDNHQEHLQLLL
jgi:phosphoserine phosphatase